MRGALVILARRWLSRGATGDDLEQPSQDEKGLKVPFTMRVSAPKHVLVRQIEGESVLLNLRTERYFGLDEIGSRMWASLTTADSIQASYEALLGEYEVDAEQLRCNLEELIEKLVENGLVEVSGG